MCNCFTDTLVWLSGNFDLTIALLFGHFEQDLSDLDKSFRQGAGHAEI